MKVTKHMAQQCATKLVKAKKDALDVLNEEFRNTIYEKLYSLISKDVKTFAEKHPEYFYSNADICLIGNGFNHTRVRVNKCLPKPLNGNYNYYVEEPEATIWIKLWNTIIDKKKEIDLLYIDLENTIYKLGTVKKIQDMFPEAFLKLNITEPSQLPAIPIINLQTRLQN